MSNTISERLFKAAGYIGPECYDELRALMIEAAVMLKTKDESRRIEPTRMNGHGHVRPRPDGVKARCGGPAFCRECQREAALIHAAPQHPERKPLTDDKAIEGFCSIPHPRHYLQAFIAGVRFAESEHGIKE